MKHLLCVRHWAAISLNSWVVYQELLIYRLQQGSAVVRWPAEGHGYRLRFVWLRRLKGKSFLWQSKISLLFSSVLDRICIYFYILFFFFALHSKDMWNRLKCIHFQISSDDAMIKKENWFELHHVWFMEKSWGK